LNKINGRINKNDYLQKEWLMNQIAVVENDLKDHINEIFNKINSILLDRFLFKFLN